MERRIWLSHGGKTWHLLSWYLEDKIKGEGRAWRGAAAAAAAKSLQSCPTRCNHCPWDSPGKNTGVGCHFLLQCMKVKSESEVTQSCLTLSNPMDCSLPGSSIHGIFQARVLEWGAIAFSKLLYVIEHVKIEWPLKWHSAGDWEVQNSKYNQHNLGLLRKYSKQKVA